MLLGFDVDCGELIGGRRFVARGLADDGPLQHPDTWDEPEPTKDPVPGFSLEYELVPGVPAAARGDVFRYLVGITYEADVELPWDPTDGGAIAPFEGGDATHGSRGSWPLPNEARTLTFTLFGVDGSTGFPSPEPAGQLVVDRGTGAAGWHAAG